MLNLASGCVPAMQVGALCRGGGPARRRWSKSSAGNRFKIISPTAVAHFTGQLIQSNHFATRKRRTETRRQRSAGVHCGFHGSRDDVLSETRKPCRVGRTRLSFGLSIHEPDLCDVAELREVARWTDSEGFEEESEIEFAVYAASNMRSPWTGDRAAQRKFQPLPTPAAKVLASPPDRSVNLNETSPPCHRHQCDGQRVQVIFNCNEISAATRTNLVIASFQATNVGRYKLRASDGVQYFTITEIQINTDGASDRPRNPNTGTHPPHPYRRGAAVAAMPLPPWTSVWFAAITTCIFSYDLRAARPGPEAPHCGDGGGTTYRAPTSPCSS